jgi:hypothetical protein
MTRNALEIIGLPICELAQETLKSYKMKGKQASKAQMMNTLLW